MNEIKYVGESAEARPERSGPLSMGDRALWLAMVLVPFIFAVCSWAPSGERTSPQAIFRAFSLPVTAIELAVILFAVLTRSSPTMGIRRVPGWAQALLATLLIVATATAFLVAKDQVSALIRTYAWVIHLFFGFSLWSLLTTRWTGLRPWLWPWIVGGVGLYTLTLATFVSIIPDPADFDWRFFGLGVTHIRQVGFYSVVGACAALGLAAVERRPLRYGLAVAFSSLFLALSYWSGTRGSLVAVIAAFVLGLMALPALRTWRAVLALAIGNMAGALISLVHQAPHSFYGIFRISQATATTGVDAISTGRITQWRDSAAAALERPFFGYGESQYPFAVPSFADFNHPHNIILQVLISWGLVGLVCFAALGLFLAWEFLRTARARDAESAPAVLVAAGLAVMGFYEGSLYHPYPVAMLTIAVAFVLSSDGLSSRAR